jgi:predicted RNA-binding Zn-ribbon protein involved in translation (DUF1610 family)
MARTVKCPSCGAELTVKEGNRDFMFCEYCGLMTIRRRTGLWMKQKSSGLKLSKT